MIHVQSKEQIAEVARLADITWRQYYTPIIGQAQVDYMLEKFQSEKAIAAQIADDYEYYLLEDGEGYAGYFAVVPQLQQSALLLSKIYVLEAKRGCGYGQKMLLFAEDLCRQRQLKTLWLTVNKNNSTSIAWYTQMGFTNSGPIVQDIGNGFVMDDYRMEKVVC
jgi:diamine N-acetyltransferase